MPPLHEMQSTRRRPRPEDVEEPRFVRGGGSRQVRRPPERIAWKAVLVRGSSYTDYVDGVHDSVFKAGVPQMITERMKRKLAREAIDHVSTSDGDTMVRQKFRFIPASSSEIKYRRPDEDEPPRRRRAEPPPEDFDGDEEDYDEEEEDEFVEEPEEEEEPRRVARPVRGRTTSRVAPPPRSQRGRVRLRA